MRFSPRLLPRIVGLVSMLCLPPSAFAQTTVEAFTPQGTVKEVRQVTARFSAQAVPFGDLRLADPFTVDCPEKGVGRWIDGRNWSFDFERDLPAGVRCSFTLKPGLQDVAAKPVSGDKPFVFDTGGPAVVEMSPREGQQVDENQIFVLGLDALAREDSVLANTWCRAEGINEKIPVRLIGGAEREQVLAARKNFIERHLHVYFKARGIVWRSTIAVANKRKDALPFVVLQCKRSFPAKAKVALVWGKGIAAPNGLATTADQTLAYRTRADFNATFRCDRVKVKSDCIPFLPMRLAFSAPLARADAEAITLTGGGKVYRPTFDKEEAKATHLTDMQFAGPFPEKTEFKLNLPAAVKDDAGRSLRNQAQFPLTVRTDEQPPLVKFPARFGIIESIGDRMLPVTVRNVEANIAGRMRTSGSMVKVGGPSDEQDKDVVAWIRRMSGGYGSMPSELYGDDIRKSLLASAKTGSVEQFALPKPNGAAAFEVIGIPLPKPGFYIVELESPMLGAALIDKKNAKAYIQSSALVTNMAAHFKRGAESSLVWVTSLDKGQPVAKAAVAVRDCAGAVVWKGATDSNGIARIGKALVQPECKRARDFYISARSGDDFTFTMSGWQNGIESWRFNLPVHVAADTTLVSTVFDRTLLRAGETVHMKHFLRRHSSKGIELASTGSAAAATKVTLVHQGSDEKFELPLAWSATGTAEGNWAIPSAAKQGTYDVMIGEHQAGSFRVEQFRVPTMKAIMSGPKKAAVGATAVDLDVQVNYLAGGGASFAPVKLRTVMQEKGISFDGYDGFAFAAGDVKEGVEKNTGYFDDDEGEWEGEDAGDESGSGQRASSDIRTRSLTLDKAGGARVRLDQLPKVDKPKDLLAELSYQDANGETLSASTRIALWPSNYVIGIKPDDWALSRDALKFQAVVVDTSGKPVANAQVAVDFFQRLTYSHRRRLMGGFYSYENSSEVKLLGKACEGRTDAKGLLFCEVKAPADGNLILRARTVDGEQRTASTQRDVWVAGSADWWFQASDNDRIDLLPSAKRYEPGETATFQVRSPFRDATVLITVEREGILDTYVRRISGKTPAFTIPVKGSYAPNVFVSALVVRGRVAGVQPTALVDLGKPAYKLGIAPMRVGWKAHELKVDVTTDKQAYKVRDKASVTVKVARADGTALPAGSEVALAAVDAGLLELMPNTSWNLLDAMMGERILQVETSTAQMQVVGKRHFGRKAVAAGGGGGKGSRELFDTLLFWKATVSLDANGMAQVEVPINDSITGFRIVAVASGGTGLFGTGGTDIRSTQDLIVMPGLPSLVREGDRLRAGFTLRNTTAAEMKVDLGARVSGDGAAARALARQAITLAPGQAQEVSWDYQVPMGVKALAWEVDAKAGEGASDRLKVSQKVMAAVPVRTIQATLLQLDGPQTMKIQAPADAIAGRGGIVTNFSARLANELPGVREFMNAYPYTCFEQKVSRAVALRDAALWKAAVASLPAHLDGEGLVKYFPSMTEGGDTLTAYILSVSSEAGYAIPAELKTRMEDGLLNFVQGRTLRRSALATADVAVRKMAALEALSRSHPVKADALESFSVEPNLWPTSAVIDWYLVLQRSPGLPGRNEKLAQVGQILKSRLNMQGTTMGFSTERSDDWWWLMASADVNANRLLLAMLDNPAWQADMGRLARGTLGRQHKGRWGTTVANAWGVMAIEKFSTKFESVPVTGASSVRVGNTVKETNWNARGTSTVTQPWPQGAAELALSHSGTGKPWATVQSMAAIPLKTPLSSGYRILRTVTPVEQKLKGAWSHGDIYRVRLDLEAQADMTWVVVDDPIPASASVLGTGLGRDSQIATGGERQAGWIRPVFEERSFDGFRAYYSFVPKGKFSVEYTVRLNNQGSFSLPPTHVEAMYSPEMFGDLPNAQFEVGP